MLPVMAGAWVRDAACRDVDLEVFFPEPARGKESFADALAYCRTCPVAAECLSYALEDVDREEPKRYGMFGGKRPIERFRLADEAT
ncbi:MAG: WhiB family transcriptional regulator [Nitriliruptoraceae bacterium]|nr:WhiB family transcriptional regulator [Nitriliruptoraceae bacterium]